MDFTLPEKNWYAYKLEGLNPGDTKWHYTKSQRSVSYTNLTPGNYVFRVKGANNDGVWNEVGTSLRITILPPFWQTTWFRVFSILILIIIIIFTYRYRVNRIKRINKELEEHVQERTAQLEASNKELESFTYSVSHDLRTPLRGINGYTKVIEEDFEDELSDEIKQYFNKIVRASTRMGDLIDSLLKLSRIMRKDLKIEQINLSNLASEIIDELKVANSARDVKVRIQPNMFVNVDASLMRIVLENLLQNAWKFTEPEDVAKIEFGFIYDHGINNYYVKDNGVGFDMEYVNKLFTPFSRLHTEKEFEGTGIGLASVRKIIEKHGGKIWAESKIDEGATFYFTL
jgi:light-regulated signal transduction histidine kinase (bacteriophytochrome)